MLIKIIIIATKLRPDIWIFFSKLHSQINRQSNFSEIEHSKFSEKFKISELCLALMSCFIKIVSAVT